MTKSEIRSIYRQKRLDLTKETADALSLEIANRLLSLEIWQCRYFHVFLPIRSKNEVDTEYILALLQGKDKEIVLSRSDFRTGKMHHLLLTDATRISVNAFGIPEPEDGIEVPVGKIDAVIVPLLAFDENGQRIGYGKGFYDRFLADCRADVVKIGVSFHEVSIGWSDVEATDVPLDFCVTPTQVYDFRPHQKPF